MKGLIKKVEKAIRLIILKDDEYLYSSTIKDILKLPEVKAYILSSPTNLRSERECPNTVNHMLIDKIWHTTANLCGAIDGESCIRKVPCCFCQGKGIIPRPLTLQEVVETLKEIISSRTYAHHWASMHKGERIVIARDKEE